MKNQTTQNLSTTFSPVLFTDLEILDDESCNRRDELISPSVNKFFQDLVGAEDGLEYFNRCDADGQSRIDYLGKEINSRRGMHFEAIKNRNELCTREHHAGRVSANFVSQSSMERFFGLMELGRNELSGLLTSEDLNTILNDYPFPVWKHLPGTSCYEEDFPAVLSEKLIKLSALQKVALIDLCETLLRTEYEQSLEDTVSIFGIKLQKSR